MARLFQDEITEITPELKEKLKKNYFNISKPKLPSFIDSNIVAVYFLIVLSIFFLINFSPGFWTYFLISVMILISFVLVYKWLTPYFKALYDSSLKPSHTLIEKWLIEDILKIVKPKAIELLSLNPRTITPDNFIIVPHPVYWNINNIPPENIKRINVGEYFNYSTHVVQVLALSQNYISYFHCYFDWTNNNAIVSPYTLEFFYEDISSIRIETQPINATTIDAPSDSKEPEHQIGNSQVVVIKNKSGESINITVNIPSLLYTPRVSLKADRVMQILRIMLRNRRFGEEYQIFSPENL